MAVCVCGGCVSKATSSQPVWPRAPTTSPDPDSDQPPTMGASPEASSEIAVACPKRVHNTFAVEPCDDRDPRLSRFTANRSEAWPAGLPSVASPASVTLPPPAAPKHRLKTSPPSSRPSATRSAASLSPSSPPPDPFERTLGECIARVRESGGEEPAICKFPRPLDQMDFGQIHCNARCASASGLVPRQSK
jgi:hypothetical protein